MCESINSCVDRLFVFIHPSSRLEREALRRGQLLQSVLHVVVGERVDHAVALQRLPVRLHQHAKSATVVVTEVSSAAHYRARDQRRLRQAEKAIHNS